MKEVHVLFKFAENLYGGVDIDTTSSSGIYRDLSPFVLGPIETYIPGTFSKNFENLWQFSKVYKEYIHDSEPTPGWYYWRDEGWSNPRAVRYPMGKGRRPEYSYWDGKKLGYIDARKKIYAPIYAEYVVKTDSFKHLQLLYLDSPFITLRDYDAYDHIRLGMTLKDVINNPKRKCGHAFILAMILTGELEECLK